MDLAKVVVPVGPRVCHEPDSSRERRTGIMDPERVDVELYGLSVSPEQLRALEEYSAEVSQLVRGRAEAGHARDEVFQEFRDALIEEIHRDDFSTESEWETWIARSQRLIDAILAAYFRDG
jgi:hypothetical protein